ncbi:hypothetical protein [Streptomyces hoynatensis]|uniref:Uncharacterized protein n=1 Tax=Streptomyces hoynatensis TaxID=1141874 RepID=A0A3A9ZBY8_9ACTN|nr:hypothetical protein [Streptomyces hoynatensis]RKN45831.1 hypothetical protein D7294_05140 [Streptomyces hoynatensis]
MRPQRFQQFALDTYQAAGLAAEPWEEKTKRPLGIVVTLPGGSRLWHAINAQARDGDTYDQPEEPVEKDAPEPVPVPELGARIRIADAEHYLSALLNNAGNRELAGVYCYSDREQPGSTRGFGLHFHSGARIFVPFVRAARAGQSPGKDFDLPQEI